jgi:hypothetical protein
VVVCLRKRSLAVANEPSVELAPAPTLQSDQPMLPLCMESSTTPRDTAWAMSEENVEITRRAFAESTTGGWEACMGTYWDP